MSDKKKPSQKRRSRELSTRKLFEAGIAVFSKCGFEAATTKQIAKCAGMNEALIARYFKGKAGLLQSIVVDYVKTNRDEGLSYPQGNTLQEEFKNYLMRTLEKIQKNRDFDRIIMSRALNDPKLGRELEQFLFIEPGNPLLARLEFFKQKGEIAPDRDLKVTAQYLLNQTMGLFFTSAVVTKLDCETAIKSIEQLAFDLAEGLKQPLR